MEQTFASTQQIHTLDVHPPFARTISEDLAIPPWLQELRRFRGRILFGDSSLPTSKYFHSTPDDPDPFDSICFHIVARFNGHIIGCARISRIMTEEELRSYMGSMELNSYDEWRHGYFGNIGVSGRLIVDPEFRSLSLANRLIASSFVLSHAIGLTNVLAIVGTGHGQDRILIRCGALPVPGVERFFTTRFPDQVRLLYFPTENVPATFRGLVERMEEELRDALNLLAPSLRPERLLGDPETLPLPQQKPRIAA